MFLHMQKPDFLMTRLKCEWKISLLLTMIAFILNLPIVDISPDKNFNSNSPCLKLILILIELEKVRGCQIPFLFYIDLHFRYQFINYTFYKSLDNKCMGHCNRSVFWCPSKIF